MLQILKAGAHLGWTLPKTWLLFFFFVSPSPLLAPLQAQSQPRRGDRLGQLSANRAPGYLGRLLGPLLPLRQPVERQGGGGDVQEHGLQRGQEAQEGQAHPWPHQLHGKVCPIPGQVSMLWG